MPQVGPQAGPQTGPQTEASDNARAKLGQYAVSSNIAAAPATVELIPPRKTPLLCLCPLDLALAHHLADRPVLRLV